MLEPYAVKAARTVLRGGYGGNAVLLPDYQIADGETTKTLKEYAGDTAIYRQETLTDTADIRITYGYTIPEGFFEREKQFLEAETEAAA